MVWAGGCLGSQPPRPFCLFHFHFLLPLTVLLFTFSFSAHSIKAKDLRFSSSNFPANSIFGANTQSDVTNIISGSLSCAIGITGDGKPVYCETGGDCTDGNPSTLCICADSSSGVLPTFKSHLCVDPQLYHPKIQIISDPRLQTCPAPYIVDVDISNSDDANKYIRAMSYRYVAQWIKNYTPKCWAGLDDSECPGGFALDDPNAPKMLLVDIPLAPTSPVEQSHCCSKATGGPSNPVFGAFNATATTENSKTHITSIDTLNTTTCNVQLNTKLSCGGTDFCSYCPTTTKYTTWKSSEFCMCESAGTPCGTSCRICSGSPPYQCVPPNTSCSGGQIWDFGSCSCVCPSGLVWDGSSCVCPAGLVWNGSSCVSPICTPSCGDCEDCVLGVCQSDCQFGEVCCGGNCYDDTCTVSGETWDSSTCSCQPPNPCQGVVCGGTCSECKVGTGTCGPITDCCTSNIECLGSCNNCDLGTNTCTGGCSGSQVCCSGTCQANCGCPQTPKPSCSNCWETNNYSWQSYPTCSWTGSCTGSQPTCTPPQTWDSGTCSCVTVDPCNSCSPSQDCCNDTCYNQCPSGQTRNSSCICVPDPCPPCGTCETCVSGSCVNKSNGIACGNCGDCQSGICSNEGPQPCSECTAWNSSSCSCVNRSNGTSCSNCGTCSNGSCNQGSQSCGSCQTWSSSQCRCESICTPGQDCCNNTCYNSCPSGQIRNSSCVCISNCSCGGYGAWLPQSNTVCSPQSFTQTRTRSCNPSGCSTESQDRPYTGTKNCCSCGGYGAWLPQSNTVCSPQSFTQTRTRSCNPSGCSTESQDRPYTGTKNCCSCGGYGAWLPQSNTVCSPQSFTQTRTRSCNPSGCSTESQDRPYTGTKNCCSCGGYGAWLPQSNTVCSPQSFTQTRTRSCNPSGCSTESQDRPYTGTKASRCTGSNSCGSWSGWSACVGGTKSRSRTCSRTSVCGADCDSVQTDEDTCDPCDGVICPSCRPCQNGSCGSAPTCPGGQILDSNCNCTCTSSSQCSGTCYTCSGGNCQAPSTSCPSGQSWDSSSCSCEQDSPTCPSDADWLESVSSCVCWCQEGPFELLGGYSNCNIIYSSALCTRP